jgi:hypothetical protein
MAIGAVLMEGAGGGGGMASRAHLQRLVSPRPNAPAAPASQTTAGSVGGLLNGDGLEDETGEVLDLMDMLEDFAETAQKMGKIFCNFYQIVSTFLKSLDIPWPAAFSVVMARVSVVNLNLVQLPKAACLNPSPSYYTQFNGYTLGLFAAELLLAALWLLGRLLLAPLFLRGVPPAEREERMARFNSTLLSRTLLAMYLVYPGVSVAIFGAPPRAERIPHH